MSWGGSGISETLAASTQRQHLTPLAHKLQARVPMKEVEKERMGSLISGDTTHLPLQWGMSGR